MRKTLLAAIGALSLLSACGGSSGAPGPVSPVPTSVASTAPMWSPGGSDTFQWQLSGTIDTTVNASVYDVDAFETDATMVAQLHALGRHVICYIDAGSYETGRPDASSFPKSVIGNAYVGWPGEYWLDIRNISMLGPIMQARLDMCKQKGFDAVEPDNIDGYQNNTGFPLTAQDQLTYNLWFAQQAHNRNLSIALKNDADQVPQLVTSFDFALTEDCFQQGWCAQLQPFAAAHKAVFAVEYTDVTTSATFHASYCPQAASAGYAATFKNRNLDAWRDTCP